MLTPSRMKQFSKAQSKEPSVWSAAAMRRCNYGRNPLRCRQIKDKRSDVNKHGTAVLLKRRQLRLRVEKKCGLWTETEAKAGKRRRNKSVVTLVSAVHRALWRPRLRNATTGATQAAVTPLHEKLKKKCGEKKGVSIPRFKKRKTFAVSKNLFWCNTLNVHENTLCKTHKSVQSTKCRQALPSGSRKRANLVLCPFSSQAPPTSDQKKRKPCGVPKRYRLRRCVFFFFRV